MGEFKASKYCYGLCQASRSSTVIYVYGFINTRWRLYKDIHSYYKKKRRILQENVLALYCIGCIIFLSTLRPFHRNSTFFTLFSSTPPKSR